MNKILKFVAVCGVVIFILNPLANSQIRKARFAGHFYPADKETLIKTVDTYLTSTLKNKIEGKVKAIIVPHAGHAFSGRTAAAAYAKIKKDYKTIVLIGPSHRTYIKGAAVFTGESFQTPLGKVSVDKKLALKLLKVDSLFKKNILAHKNEHSLDVQLPF
ncbi:MAG: AmmeMemoRadiSam system protein B, partial [Elusimicrobiota bacterium]|nr:AmmeMemoRadiSam system protein B [Elusimicrobiota bacterium]